MLIINKNDLFWETVFRKRYVPEQVGGEVRFDGDHYGFRKLMEDPGSFRVAIIGTRDISNRCPENVKRIVETLKTMEANTGLKPVVVSGLALGVDAAAHRAAIACGLPTIAVMGSGLDMVYPYMHTALADDIKSTPGSGLLTPFAEGTAPQPASLILRTYLIALMSDLVIVPESKEKGMAMVCARLAYEYDIPVLAVPGRPEDIRSQGCNKLIEKGWARMFCDLDKLPSLAGNNS